MKLITINLPEAYIDGLEKLVQEDIYPNRSEAIRLAVRDMLRKEQPFYKKQKKHQMTFIEQLS